jgi:hypothetical protein
MRIRRLAVASMIVLPVAATAQTQSATTPGPLIGITAGLNWSNLVTYGSSSSTSVHQGIIGGVQLVLPINRWFAVQPEVLYSTKGANSSIAQTDTTPSYTATLTMNYIEIPVLARFELPINEQVSSLFYVGPSLSIRRTCNYQLTVTDTLSGSSQSATGCANLTTASGQIERLNTIDGGIVAGLGLSLVRESGMVFTVAGRGSFSLGHVSPDASDHNVVMSLLIGVAVPIGR